jgi:predicted permease
VHDLRVTLRSLGRTPGYALTAIGSLALGIGANVAIFSLLDQALLRTLPIERPDRLVFLYHPGPLEGSSSTDESGGPSFSYPVFRALQSATTRLSGLAGARSMRASVSYEREAALATVHRVSGNYFSVLGIGAAVGRLLSEHDDRVPGEHPVAVLGHRFWATRFGADPSVVGRKLVVNGRPLTIVGVVAPGFESERPGTVIDVFVPITMNREISPDWDGFADRKDHWVTLLGRLEPQATREGAEAALGVAYRAQLEADIAAFGRRDAEFLRGYRSKRIVLRPGRYGRGEFREEVRTPLLVLMGMTLLVLLMVCANLASLQMARGARRTRELAVRLAVGASRARLIRALMVEASVLAGCGAGLGLLAAHWTTRSLVALLSDLLPAPLTAELDGRLLAFSVALTALTVILAGLLPAFHASQVDLVTSLKGQPGEGGPSRSAGPVRRALVTAQIAVCVLLLVGAGLLARTFVNLTRVDLGLDLERLVVFALEPKLNAYDDARAASLYRDLTNRLGAVPGVALVTAARVPAIADTSSSANVTVEGSAVLDDDAADSSFNVVGPDYFRTLGIPLRRGREFTRADAASAPHVVVVNEAFVRHFLPGQDPIGRRMATGRGRRVKLDLEIVGIVGNARYSSVRAAPPAVFYTTYLQSAKQTGLTFYVRTASDPEAMVPVVRREVAALDPSLPVANLQTMRRQVEHSVRAERLLSLLAASFAAMATILAAVGLYGTLAYDVARRTREIGIRMALGARRAEVRALVVKDVVLLAGIGSALGVALAAAGGRMLEAVLFGTTAWDPLVYASALAALAIVAVTGAYVPARRASRVDPMVALRRD